MDSSKLLFPTQKDLFIDDVSVPDETRIYYSKIQSITWLIIATLLVWGSIWCAFTDNKSYPAVIIMGPIFLFVLFKSIKTLRNRKPQIILNLKGIQA